MEKNPGRDTDRLPENSSKYGWIFPKPAWLIPRYFTKSELALIEFLWVSFPKIGLAYDPTIENSKKYWISFQEIGPHAPENWNYGKTSGWFSRIRQ